MAANILPIVSQATSKVHFLKDFKGSKEEKIVKQFFQVITTYPDLARFINLEIHKCNAEEGTCFSDAYIALRTSYECMRRERADFAIGRPKCEALLLKDMLDTDSLEEFLTGGVDAIENYNRPGVYQAFLVLLIFLREIKYHESSIGKLLDNVPKTTTKETQIMTGLAHHLFSRLVPSNIYEVDKYAKLPPKTCSCGCNGDICGGDTSLGSQGTWHGRVDILVNNVIAVAFGKEQISAADDEEDDADDGEPQRKQRKLDTNKICDIYLEAELNKRHDSGLLDLKFLHQFLAKAITNGFAQVNRNKSALSNFLIPTFGATSDHVTICLYDPQSDCLLHIDDKLKLWGISNIRRKLDPETIIIIWLFLNFTVFTKKHLSDAAKLKKSGLHSDLKEDLKYYKETTLKEKFGTKTPDGRPWRKTTVEVKHPTPLS